LARDQKSLATPAIDLHIKATWIYQVDRIILSSIHLPIPVSKCSLQTNKQTNKKLNTSVAKIVLQKQKLWSSGRALGSWSEGRGFDPRPMLDGYTPKKLIKKIVLQLERPGGEILDYYSNRLGPERERENNNFISAPRPNH